MTDIKAMPSKIAGTGCFANRSFKKGETIGEYTGDIIDGEEADERYEGIEMTYLFDIDDDMYIDAMNDSNPVKYINHSCAPNCESELDGDQIWIKAIKNIKKGDELTYDYFLEVEEDDESNNCHCKSKQCRGTMVAPPEN